MSGGKCLWWNAGAGGQWLAMDVRIALIAMCGAMAPLGLSGGGPAAPILPPKPGLEPRINGARVFGARPGRPILYTIAATGERPMAFSAEGQIGRAHV